MKKDSLHKIKLSSVLEATTNGFSDQKLLGKGSHGYVYKVVLRGRHVAVKRPCTKRPEAYNEIQILSKIQSPRLVNLVGFSSDAHRRRLLVVEFMSNNTLYDVLHSTSRTLNWGRRIRLALQTAKAIHTLHSSNPPVIHRDIKIAHFNSRPDSDGGFGIGMQEVKDSRRIYSDLGMRNSLIDLMAGNDVEFELFYLAPVAAPAVGLVA